MTPTATLIERLKANGEDHEFYPTTEEIIKAMVTDLRRGDHYHPNDWSHDVHTFLDIGAGNGKVLRRVSELWGESRDKYGRGGHHLDGLYGIEKSLLLCAELAKHAFIVGTDIKAQSLLSKQIDMTFCNPPYSEFEDWAVKILRESCSALVYLVLPIRWENSVRIKQALEYRETKAHVVGAFDFEDAEDRQARAKVHLLRIQLNRAGKGNDAFMRFFNEQFGHLKVTSDAEEESPLDEIDRQRAERETARAARERAVVEAPSYAEGLVTLYEKELIRVQDCYAAAARLDPELMRELNISPVNIMTCLKERLLGLKNTYWHQLFDHMAMITDRLTTRKRRAMLEQLNETGSVDFTLENIQAVVIWVLQHANESIDAQLLETFDAMVEKANVRLYKSNKRVFEDHDWRYNEKHPTHVALEYRLVLRHCGGIKRSQFDFEKGLDEHGRDFIGDLLTVAHNLGFNCDTQDMDDPRSWTSGQRHEFVYRKFKDGQTEEPLLFEARAFYNWNIHLRMAQKLALAMNVEVGRIRGWLRSPEEAVEELNDPAAAQYFNTNQQLTARALPRLMPHQENAA